MKVIDAINEVDKLKPNMYELPEKIKWLSRLDVRIFQEVLLKYELSAEEMAPFLVETEESETDEQEHWEAELALELEHRPVKKRPQLEFEGYTQDDSEAELIVGKPYDEMYVHWLAAQVDWYNMEYESFNNDNAMFEAVYARFWNAFNSTHRAYGARKIYY